MDRLLSNKEASGHRIVLNRADPRHLPGSRPRGVGTTREGDFGRYMMDALTALKAPAVIVTFLDEIANYGANTVSMMSMVEKDDLTQRTFKIVRKPTDGLAFAIYIAGKHGLTYELLSRRLKK